MSTRLVTALSVLAVVPLVSGCFGTQAQDKPKISAEAELVQRPDVSRVEPGPTADSADIESAKLLAAKTQSWVESIAPLANATTRRAASPWDPGNLTLGAGGVTSGADHGVPEVPSRTHPPAQPPRAQATDKPTQARLPVTDANKPLTLGEPEAIPASAVESPADPTLGKLAQQVKDYPRDIAGQLDYQLLRFVRGQPTPDMNTIAGLPEEDRELLTALLDGLGNFRSTVRADNNLLLSKKVRPILDLADRVRAQADLTIPTVSLCTRVDGFGRYEPIESPRLTAGQEHPFILYCEVENFSSQLNEKRLWDTRLTLETVLYTEGGLPIWPEKAKATELNDSARQRRHDFFVATRLALPANLTIGRYLLKVTVVDAQAKRVAEATLPIVVVAK